MPGITENPYGKKKLLSWKPCSGNLCVQKRRIYLILQYIRKWKQAFSKKPSQPPRKGLRLPPRSSTKRQGPFVHTFDTCRRLDLSFSWHELIFWISDSNLSNARLLYGRLPFFALPLKGCQGRGTTLLLHSWMPPCQVFNLQADFGLLRSKTSHAKNWGPYLQWSKSKTISLREEGVVG